MLFKRLLSRVVPQFAKNAYHLLSAAAANICFGFPGKKLLVIGITGTNGKTTTAQMIGAILRQAGKKAAVASTVDYWIGHERIINSSKYTTASAWRLQKFLREAVEAGCEYAVIETSSHALDQERVWGIPYAIAVITNVTREHLDYHHTMEGYRRAKRKLFQRSRQAVINADMEDPQYFSEAVRKPGRIIFYSTRTKETEIYGAHIRPNFRQTEFRIGEEEYLLRMPGLFNIENALAAIATAKLLGIDEQAVKEALKNLSSVPGRMEFFESAEGVDIIIDYAVTPDAFEKLYQAVLPLKIPGTKIIHVFGACGDRDRGKRPILGQIASRYADTVILTNEDPYFEDPERIIDEVEGGVTKKKDKDYFRIFDRRKAIRKALSLAERGDILLVTGKGAETSIAFGAERVPWSERQVIEEELAAKAS